MTDRAGVVRMHETIAGALVPADNAREDCCG